MRTEYHRYYFLLCLVPLLIGFAVELFNIAWQLLFWLVLLTGVVFLLRKLPTVLINLHTISHSHKSMILAISRALLPNVLCVTLGLIIICCVLVMLNLTWFIDDATVHNVEGRLSELRRSLEGVHESNALIPALCGTLLISLFITIKWPSIELVGALATAKTVSTRMLLVLTTISSFTFLGTYSLEKYENYLVSVRMEEFRDVAQNINRFQREIVASAIIIDSIQDPAELPLLDLYPILIDMPESTQARDLMQGVTRLASTHLKSSSRIREQIREINAIQSSENSESLSRVERWLDRPDQTEPPTLQDLDRINEQVHEMSKESTRATEALFLVVEEGMSRQVERLLPDWNSSILKGFAEGVAGSLVGELVEHILSFGNFRNVFNFDLIIQKLSSRRARQESLNAWIESITPLSKKFGTQKATSLSQQPKKVDPRHYKRLQTVRRWFRFFR